MLNPPITLVLRRFFFFYCSSCCALLRCADFLFLFFIYFFAVHGCKILLHIFLHVNVCVCVCVYDLKFTPRIYAISDMVVSRNLMSDSDTFRCIGWENQNKNPMMVISMQYSKIKTWCVFTFQMLKGCRNDLNKFYTLYLQKGIFVKFAILPPVLIMFVAFHSLSCSLRFFPWSSFAAPHHHSKTKI